MLRNKYGKDQIYLRQMEKEKNDYRTKQSNKMIKRFSNDSKETIQYSRKRANNTYIVNNSGSPKANKVQPNEQSYSPSRDSYFKILQPISSRAHEYEKAIKIFLGDEANEDIRLKKRNFKQDQSLSENRAKSSIGLKQKAIFSNFDQELKLIEAKEISLKKNIRNLSIKQKHLKEAKKLSRTPLAARLKSLEENSKTNLTDRNHPENSLKVYESLEKMNKILTHFLKSPSVKSQFHSQNISKAVNKSFK